MEQKKVSPAAAALLQGLLVRKQLEDGEIKHDDPKVADAVNAVVDAIGSLK